MTPDPATLYLDSLTRAYKLSRAAHSRLLRSEDRAGFLNGQGLHPLSVEWGRIYILRELEPWLCDAGEVDPVTLRRLAEQDAVDEFRQELAEAA